MRTDKSSEEGNIYKAVENTSIIVGHMKRKEKHVYRLTWSSSTQSMYRDRVWWFTRSSVRIIFTETPLQLRQHSPLLEKSSGQYLKSRRLV